MLQTVIMAGGAGTRLQPLTCHLPKPLAPLCGAPVMDYTLRLLRRHQISQAAVTLWYRPRDIEAYFGAERHGVLLRYMREVNPVGTAGSVLLAAPDARDTVLVLSGDGLTNANLSDALRFHKERRADATLVLQHVDIPLPYGVAVTDGEGRILRFIEKPDWSRVVSSLVNTGIYLLEPQALALIPRDKPFDFGRELFPLLLEKGMRLYGYPSSGYWCDVGDPAAFLRAQSDLLSGKAGFPPADAGQRALAGVEISPDSYVSPQARISPGAVIRRSCILQDAAVGAGAQLEGAILCPRAQVGQGCVLEEGAVLGAGAKAGDFVRMTGHARVWPGIHLPSCAVVTASLRQEAPITVSAGTAQAATPGHLEQLAGAFLQTVHSRHIALMQDGRSFAACSMLAGALAAYGAERITLLGRGTPGMLAYGISHLPAEGGIFCRGGEMLLMDGHGLPLTDKASAAVESRALRQELPVPDLQSSARVTSASSLRKDYIRALAREYAADKEIPVSLTCKDRFLRALARDALAQAGYMLDSGGIALSLDEGQARLIGTDQPLSPARHWLLLARAQELRGEKVYDTADLGLEEQGVLPCDGSEGCVQQQRMMQDGLIQALTLLSLLCRETLEEALSALPDISRVHAGIPCDASDKGRVLEKLLQEAAPRPQGGLCARRGDARAVIRPDPSLPLMHVAVSARDAEFAREICDFYAGRILQALHDQ